MLLEEEEWKELLGNSKEFRSFDGFSNDDTNEMDVENNIENTRMRWIKEVNKIFMTYFYQSDPTKRAYQDNLTETST